MKKIKYIRNEDMVWEEVGDGIVLVDGLNGLMCNLNQTAKSIWILLEKEISVNEIIELLKEEYESVDKTEVEELLLSMKNNSFINES